VTPPGRRPTLLARLAGSAAALAWSPDGRRLAFELTLPATRTSDPRTGLWVVDASGASLRRLADGGDAVWSPDGKRLAYRAGDDVWVIGAGGSGARRLTHHPAHEIPRCWR
jgi:Tol biopolymer transport system component